MAAKYPLHRLAQFPELDAVTLLRAYEEMCLARCHVERVVQEVAKGTLRFAIWGPGEELHGVASALAYHRIVDPQAFGLFGHYRSAGLLAMWARLRGYDDFHLDHMRQQLSKVTDPWSGGRQMTAHFNDPRFNILPVQSALGMQMGKAVGYAEGLRRGGHRNGVVVTVVGDGTMAESDFHEGITGAAILGLPVLVTVTDNDIAISVRPQDGRGIRDLEAYARAFDLAFFSCDGNDFLDTYDTAGRAAAHCRDQQRPALLHVRNLSRLNGHSSAADITFDLAQHDCVNDFGEALVEAGIARGEDVVRRNSATEGKDYFKRHDLGTIGKRADDHIVETMRVAGGEPEPTHDSIFEHLRDPYPAVVEPALEGRSTNISLNGAIRAALRDILAENPLTWLYGQDIGRQGGVMQATKGLIETFPDQVRDAPINEPLILGAACGFALHPGATALPEIQFSDYSLNTFHWLVYLGNLLWTSNGTARANVIVRLPVEPLHGGAVYHSMCMEGFYGAIPGLTIIAPTTSRDFYGLLRTAAEYQGPVLVFESKGLYRQPLGDAFPGEPTGEKEIAALKRAIGFQGVIPDLPKDFRVPLGKAAVRRTGTDLTIATWGRAHWFCHEAVESLARDGVSVELIDMRTVVPPDLETVIASVEKTGRLLVVHEDRVFSSIGREIQGAVVETTTERGRLVVTKVLGQEAVPGIPQNVNLEEHIVVTPEKVVAAAKALLATKVAAATTDAPRKAAVVHPPEPSRTQVLWTPNRNFVA
jgi:2-oxoisovalerate dehydrogenase E1 component